MSTPPFNLFAGNHPPMRPNTSQWSELLHWCVAVLDHDDTHLPFAASLLADAIRHGGLTDKQAKYANRTLKHVIDLHAAGLLECQVLSSENPARAGEGPRDAKQPGFSVIDGGLS